MNLRTLRELDFSDIGAWPLALRLGALALLCLAVVGAAVALEYRTQWPELQAAQRKEIELKSVFQSKAAKAANLEAYTQQLEEMQLTFGTLLRQLPNKTEVADLLVDISQTGLASGLEFELFKPQQEVPKDFYAELPISIRVLGNYHEFGAFVSGVAALPRIVTLRDVLIEPHKEQQGTGEQDTLVMELTATTYRYLEEGEQAGAAATPADAQPATTTPAATAAGDAS